MVFSLVACGHHPEKTNQPVVEKQNNPVNVYAYKIKDGFGYAIEINGKPFIRQECIPAVQGNHYFKTETDAKRTGDLVAEKIRNHARLTVTVQDLQQLGVIKNDAQKM